MANLSGMATLRSMVAASAIYNGKRDTRDDYTDVCHPGTREKHLKDLTTWADNGPADERLQWASAIAGAGKTAMMRTFCHLLEKKVGPFASFFIWQSDAKRNTLSHFAATVAYQLARRITALVPHIEKAFADDQLVLETSFENQMEQLIVKPLLNVKVDHHLIIVVDGLDELDAKSQIEFLDFIPNFLSRLQSLPISLLVSSRPDAEIVAAFNHPKLATITKSTRLGASDEDIWKFLNDKFDDINIRYPHLQIEHGGQWPSHAKRAIMVMQSSGLFIWPTVAIDYIDKVKLGLSHNKRLEQVLSSADPKPWIASPLDNLYRAILQAHAPEDPESMEFLHFKQRLAYLCLPIRLGEFVHEFKYRIVDWSDTPVLVVFDETLDELWDSVAGLSSLFSPRTRLSKDESPTPGISHHSFRDFTFNRARCGDKVYYASEQDLNAEVVCKLFKFFNTRQAYRSCTEMSVQFLGRVGSLVESHLRKAAVSEKLGRCMDDVMLEVIPPTWPLVTQVYWIVRLFESLYNLAESVDFPDGARRREAFLSKVVAFIKIRTANAEEWDIALFRMAISTADLDGGHLTFHSVNCWHIARSPQCTCVFEFMRNLFYQYYQRALCDSTMLQHVKSRLVDNRQDDIVQDSLNILRFFLSLSQTSQRATELSLFIHLRDFWIRLSLKHCPPNSDLLNTLVPICTAPLSSLPERKEDSTQMLVSQFVEQTEAFNEYTERCREAGIETNFSPITIPENWWHVPGTRDVLILLRCKPPFEIPDYWWRDNETRVRLLEKGYKPRIKVADDWWQHEYTRHLLLEQGYKPQIEIADDWWHDEKTRRLLRCRGYLPPYPYSAEETASESEPDWSSDSDSDEDDELPADEHVSGNDEVLPGGQASSSVASPQVQPPSPPVVPLSNPLHTPPVATAHPTTPTPVVGTENGQVGPSNVVAGRRRRGFRGFLKGLSCV